MNLWHILLPVLSYLAGSVPFGFLIAKRYGIDIRKVGSGNIGATNVTRSVGKGAGKLCFFLDFLKGAVPVLAAQWALPEEPAMAMAAAVCTLLGHMFPVFLHFKGGKGVATAAGCIIAMAPYPLIAAFTLWAVVFYASRYVSLASIVAAVTVPVFAILFRILGCGSATANSNLTLGFLVLIAVLAVYRHRSNIKRLLNGTESRFEKRR